MESKTIFPWWYTTLLVIILIESPLIIWFSGGIALGAMLDNDLNAVKYLIAQGVIGLGAIFVAGFTFKKKKISAIFLLIIWTLTTLHIAFLPEFLKFEFSKYSLTHILLIILNSIICIGLAAGLEDIKWTKTTNESNENSTIVPPKKTTQIISIILLVIICVLLLLGIF